MNSFIRSACAGVCLLSSLSALRAEPLLETAYAKAIRLTSQMSRNEEAQKLAAARGLRILDLTWEDTGRFQGSSVGPNISDMTIQVARKNLTGKLEVTCMPVIRFPNFTDKTCDLNPRDFTLLVGNQKGGELKRVSLHEFLEDPLPYLHNPDSWKPKGDKPRLLLAPDRDSKVLVSAQACFLPVPKSGKATFNPVLFNYQSVSGDPAVLTLLVTREGTSVTVIDNKRDAFGSGSAWGQRLFFNANGQRASLTGKRQSDFEKKPSSKEGSPSGTAEASSSAGMNMVLLIQVPLKQKNPPRPVPPMAMTAMPAPAPTGGAPRSNVENAVIGHGAMEGPFTEIDNLDIERDPKFPIRVTIQFYKATSNGVVCEEDLNEIKTQIDRIYENSDAVGSLVTDGSTGRITEYEGTKVQPKNWWADFWKRHEKNTGDDRETALKKLRELLGDDPESQPVSDLYLRALLRKK